MTPGQSVTSVPGHPDYGQAELIADAVGLLDALRVSRAHVVGISMDGAIGQHLALRHSDRVASLTLISTSPGPGGPEQDDLPPTSDELAAAFAEPAGPPDWSNRDEVIDYSVESLRPFAGSHAVDEDSAWALVVRVVDRTLDIESSMTNHWMLEGGEPVRPRLGSITQPTLVLHGTADPLSIWARRSPGRRDPRSAARAARGCRPRVPPAAGVGPGRRGHPRPHPSAAR